MLKSHIASKGALNMLIDNNTVAAHNQMRNSSHISFFGNPEDAKRILVGGNSITRHGPNAEIGWGQKKLYREFRPIITIVPRSLSCAIQP